MINELYLLKILPATNTKPPRVAISQLFGNSTPNHITTIPMNYGYNDILDCAIQAINAIHYPNITTRVTTRRLNDLSHIAVFTDADKLKVMYGQ
jgi:hypothetical protein